MNNDRELLELAAKHQFMEGYRIGLAEMREKCAKVVESGVLGHGECAAAIRAINFEGDTGFRPVSEMIAEHKQDPKKAAAIEKAKMRKAEQKPVGMVIGGVFEPWNDDVLSGAWEIYAAPIRTKDLTDDEIFKLFYSNGKEPIDHYEFARAVIAADREKNNANNNS